MGICPLYFEVEGICGKQDSDLYQTIFLRPLLLIPDLLWVNIPDKEKKLCVKIPEVFILPLKRSHTGFWPGLIPRQFHFTGNSEVYSPKGPGLAKLSTPWFCLLIFTEISLLLFSEYEIRKSTVVMVVQILKTEAGSMNSRNKAIVAEI